MDVFTIESIHYSSHRFYLLISYRFDLLFTPLIPGRTICSRGGRRDGANKGESDPVAALPHLPSQLQGEGPLKLRRQGSGSGR